MAERYMGPIRSRRDLCRFYTPRAHEEKSCSCYLPLRARLKTWFLRQLFPSGFGFMIVLVVGIFTTSLLYSVILAWSLWAFLEFARIGPEYERYHRDYQSAMRGK